MLRVLTIQLFRLQRLFIQCIESKWFAFLEKWFAFLEKSISIS